MILLLYFCRNDPTERASIVSVLLSHGAQPNYPRNARSKSRYIETAIRNTLILAAKVLLENGAVVEDLVVNSEGGKSWRTNFDPPVSLAILRRNNEALNLLLLHGASLEYCNFWDEKIVLLFKILEHYKSADDAAEAVKIYSQHGGNLWLEHEGQNILQALKCQNSQYYFTSGDRAKLENTIENLMLNPNSLLDASRLAIRKAVGGQLWCKADNLPLPPQIKSYLMFPNNS